MKIDMSLVREVEHSLSIRGLIKAIVELGQGYLYGKPGPLKWSTKALSA